MKIGSVPSSILGLGTKKKRKEGKRLEVRKTFHQGPK
jgi:hypothetical protein